LGQPEIEPVKPNDVMRREGYVYPLLLDNLP
jgi:hypothetical protein